MSRITYRALSVGNLVQKVFLDFRNVNVTLFFGFTKCMIDFTLKRGVQHGPKEGKTQSCGWIGRVVSVASEMCVESEILHCSEKG